MNLKLLFFCLSFALCAKLRDPFHAPVIQKKITETRIFPKLLGICGEDGHLVALLSAQDGELAELGVDGIVQGYRIDQIEKDAVTLEHLSTHEKQRILLITE